MYVIRHYHPCQQSIALAIKVEDRVLYDFRDVRFAKPACATPGVKIGSNALLPFGIVETGGKRLDLLLPSLQ